MSLQIRVTQRKRKQIDPLISCTLCLTLGSDHKLLYITVSVPAGCVGGISWCRTKQNFP